VDGEGVSGIGALLQKRVMVLPEYCCLDRGGQLRLNQGVVEVMEPKIGQDHADLVKAIADIAATMPLARTVQLYQFALFLKTHPLPTEETFEEIVADEAIWDAQFAATDDDKLAALVAAVEMEISEGKALPMFDEHGRFIEHS